MSDSVIYNPDNGIYYTGWSTATAKSSSPKSNPPSPRSLAAQKEVAEQEYRLAMAKEGVLAAENAIARTEAVAHRAWSEAQEAEEALAKAEAAKLQAIAEDEADARAEALHIAEAEAASLARAATMAEDALKRVAMEADTLRKAAAEASEAQKRAFADAEAVRGMTFAPASTTSPISVDAVLASLSPAALRMLIKKGAVSPTGALVAAVSLTEEEEDNCGSGEYLFFPFSTLSLRARHPH